VSTQDLPRIIGLTGGIASGKSTVSRMLQDAGIPVIDADALAREVVLPSEPAYREIVEHFGDDIVGPNGELDRAALGAIIFSNQEAKRALESITHPRIAAAMLEQARCFGESGHRWVVYDAALIVESGHEGAFSALVVVSVDPDTQMKRLRARDGFTPEEAALRIENQLPIRDKAALADYVIDNNETRTQTRIQVETVIERIRAEIVDLDLRQQQ
jgi:dephospho-CoA kinase